MSHSRRLALSILVVSVVGGAVFWSSTALADSGAQTLRIEHGTPDVSQVGLDSPLSINGIAVGETRSTTGSITNRGSAAALYLLQVDVRRSDALPRQIRVSITRSEKGASTVLYDGRLASLRRVEIGHLEPGDQSTLIFRVTLLPTGSAKGDNDLQGLATHVRMTWSSLRSAS